MQQEDATEDEDATETTEDETTENNWKQLKTTEDEDATGRCNWYLVWADQLTNY